MAWLYGYARRQKIACSSTTAGAQTNYTKELTIFKGIGSSSPGVIYLKNNALNWPYDIRFTKSDGLTSLDFYREESDSIDGTWHVELDSIAGSGDTDFYIYYGKSGDSDASNGSNTFQFFDDFETGNFSRWTSAESDWTNQSSIKYEGTYAAKSTGALNNKLSKTQSLSSILVSIKINIDALAELDCMPILPKTTDDSGVVTAVDFYNGDLYYYDAAWHSFENVYSADTWFKLEVAYDFGNSLCRLWINKNYKGSFGLYDGHDHLLDSGDSFASFYAEDRGQGLFLDQYLIRKYVYPEPAWANPGTEELAVYLIPNAADTTGISSQEPSSGNHFDKVDDPVGSPDGDTTYVYTASTSYQYDLYGLPDQSLNGTISKVSITIRIRDSSGDNYAKCAYQVGSETVVYGTERTTPNGVWTDFTDDFTTKDGSNPWSWTDINNLKIGVALKSPGTSSASCTQVYAVVQYSPGWLSGYAFRVKIPVTYTTVGAQTNYTKELRIIKSTGSNSAGTIYLQDRGLNWPYDIRFTKLDGLTKIDYYREEYDSTDGTWWVELDQIEASGNTDFYIYYGKASDTDDGTYYGGTQTFQFFDDFETGNLSKWTNYSATMGVQSTIKKEGTYAAKFTDPLASGTSSIDYQFAVNQTGIAVIGFTRRAGSSTYNNLFCWWDQVTDKYIIPLDISSDGNFKYGTGTGLANLPTAKTWVVDTWYRVHYAMDFNSSPPQYRWLYIKDGDAGNANMKNENNETPTTLGRYLYVNGQGNGGDQYWDQVMIRKYVYPEPAWASPDIEELSKSIPVILNSYKQRWN